MTPVGHSLVGAAVGVVCLPRYKSYWSTAGFISVFVALANLSDWRLPGWGHSRYDISHSVFVNLALIIVCAGALRLCNHRRTRIASWPIIFGGATAWLSHLLLDSFYNHGLGIAIFWPFSTARLALPMPWFRSFFSIPPPLNMETLHICLVELLFYGPILILAVGWRYWRSAHSRRQAGSSG
jgi:hypothetical protein